MVLTCDIPPSNIAMRGPANAATDDLIVEPIEEAVAMYDNLLKELQMFMVSHLFLGLPSSARFKRARASTKVVQDFFLFHLCSELLTELC
jgi:hypothetical protein